MKPEDVVSAIDYVRLDPLQLTRSTLINLRHI
jgi:hypothetical protein